MRKDHLQLSKTFLPSYVDLVLVAWLPGDQHALTWQPMYGPTCCTSPLEYWKQLSHSPTSASVGRYYTIIMGWDIYLAMRIFRSRQSCCIIATTPRNRTTPKQHMLAKFLLLFLAIWRKRTKRNKRTLKICHIFLRTWVLSQAKNQQHIGHRKN